ncbi:RagB/SusD family nutrient uptake outer membrane protein [Maribellus maritimus]|uniref:RagB/SusD family nutrient uptake outer membrane protein n=1 Tax=Maribellus maritimus TaxID=2870838 RepID=UPI001EEC29B9|nr:RagB/SusD family nutrient uptake outer membrane protein [Maribellus maritimus]MCG6190322.1 RagB/SusD family nutrient uptake outer membrane protein [Maribellus maritimus]
MKKIKNIAGLALAFLLVFTMSCNDNFLVQEPLSTLSPENTFVNQSGLQTALDAALKGIFNQWNGDAGDLQFDAAMGDYITTGKTDNPNMPSVDMRTYCTPQTDYDGEMRGMRRIYDQDYQQIKNANTVIDNIDFPEWAGGANDPERNHLLGSAYFCRAFFYLQLTLGYGNVAFPLNVISEARQDFKAFYMQGIWDQMIADLEWAEQWVKPKSELPIGQPPVNAVRILLAKYYMMNQRFSDAEAMMNEVISSGQARLFTQADVDASGVKTVMVGNNENPFTGELIPGFDCEQPADPVNLLFDNENNQKVNNPEGIYTIVNAPFVDGSQGRSARPRAWGPNFVSTTKGVKAPPSGTVTGMDIRQDQVTKQMMKFGRGQGFSRTTNYGQYELWQFKGGEMDNQDYRHKRGNWFDMDMMVYDNPDLSETEWYLQPARLWYNGTLLCEDSIRCWFGYPIYKFWAHNYEDQVKRQDGGKQNMYIMRMGEVYLIRAEARFWQENYAGAADDLNVIRQRANAKEMYTAGDLQSMGIGAILDERARELYGEEYRHFELARISVIFAKTGKTCYNGKTYSWDGKDMEKSLSQNNFYYDRMIEKNNFFRENVAWSTYPDIKYTMDPKHIFWPVYEDFIIGNVGAILNQTTGYDGSENNIEPLTHVVQPAGEPNVDPMVAIGEVDGE